MTCEVCLKPIPKARLRALPATRRCVRCSDEEPVREEAIGSLDRVTDAGQVPDYVDTSRVEL